MKKIRQLFLSGTISLLPIVVTAYVMYLFLTFLDNLLGTFIEYITGRTLPGVGILASLLLILLTGFLVTNVIGARLFRFGERLLQKIPVVTKIYSGMKQITDAFSLQGRQAFSRVALVEYPRQGTYAVGFVTGEMEGEIQEKVSDRLISIFIPTTPNPTSGMLIMVPAEDIIYLDLSVEEGLKLIVSGGIVAPK